MKYTKLMALFICLCMVVSMFAACDNSNTNSGGTGSNAGTADTTSNDQYIDDETGEIVNIGDPETMKITPEEIGNVSNPVVRGLEAWISDRRIAEHISWKEEAYGLIYDYDTCDEASRTAKWVSAFVSGDAYDVLWMLSGDFPTVAQNGLVQPLENIMPVYDESYFYQAATECFTWKGRVYGVNAWQGVDAYGVHFNATLFENAGETTPMEHYENGTWTFDTFLDTIKAMHNVEGSADDVHGLAAGYDRIVMSAVIANGGSILKFTDTGVELNLTDPKTVYALEWTNTVRTYAYQKDTLATYTAGKAAMTVERHNQINNARSGGSNYEFSWVPFPTGPDGDGAQAGSIYGWAIGKGAKNVEGAMAWIAADNYRDTWFEEHPIESYDTRTEEELAMYKEAEAKGKPDNYNGIIGGIWQLLEDANVMGVAAAIEKHSPTYQAKIDQLMAIESTEAKIDFEAQGVFDFNTADSRYPFVNVIDDANFTYGTEDVQSLKIDLSSMTEFGAIAYTNPELFKLQNGGQYKVTFKLLCEVDPGTETLAVAARTTEALDGSPTFGLTWLTPKAGEVTEVEVYINVNDNFNGDLAVVLLGQATETNPDLSIVIDDFQVELVAGE